MDGDLNLTAPVADAPAPAAPAAPEAPLNPDAIDTAVAQNTPAAPAPTDPAQKQPAAPAAPAEDWRQSVPEAWREVLKDVATPEDAFAALQRGMGYQPVAKAEDVKLDMPEGVAFDQGVQDNFKEFCVTNGITAKQAQALLDWQLGANKEITDKIIADGQQTLKASWGSRAEENRATAMRAVTALDRRMEGRLAAALGNGMGLANNPALVEAFYHMGQLMSEDTLGGGMPAAPVQPETPEQSYKGAFKE